MSLLYISIFLVILCLSIIIFIQFKILSANNELISKLKTQDEYLKNQFNSLDSIEYAITGTSLIQKGAQDYIREKFTKDKKLSSDNTSLRDFLERQNYRHRDIQLIKIELEYLRELWEYRNISSSAKFDDTLLQNKMRNYKLQWLRAMGVEGEALDKAIEEFEKIYVSKAT